MEHIELHVKIAEQIGLNRKKCSRCGLLRLYGNWDIHHINGDHQDNRPENLTILCDHCHVCTTFSYGSDQDGIVDEWSWIMDGVIQEE